MQISDLSLNKYILPYFSQKKIICQLPLNIFAASNIKSFQTALSEKKSSYCARLVIFLSYKCYQQKDLVMLTTKNFKHKKTFMNRMQDLHQEASLWNIPT